MQKGVFPGMSIWFLISIALMLIVLGFLFLIQRYAQTSFEGQQNGLFISAAVIFWVKASDHISGRL